MGGLASGGVAGGGTELPSVAYVFRQFLQQPCEQPGTLPLLESAMTGLIGRIARRQIVPRSAGAVQHRSRVLPRSTSPVFPPLRTEKRFEHRPLGVGDVHALDLRLFA
jgi:hypothetical protein